ncbi:hypothetical protein [Streptomyces sp. P3]|uniref:hypothetical protein n=1 Tax=Streptomyces sp. P3 TaxID=2135430 RepID=UPI0020B17047|nr:hypothetical protein [Streptomyces sp. P3]
MVRETADTVGLASAPAGPTTLAPIGEVLSQGPGGRVTLRTLIGARQVVECRSQQLPRIC